MRLVFISDTHSLHLKMEHPVPAGDVLIHCGDCTNVGRVAELEDFNTWIGTLPHRRKIVVAGNHDWLFQRNLTKAKRLLTNATYLQDDGLIIEKVRFWGSPWQPWFCDWAFNKQRGADIRQYWEAIPIDTNVLITHGPPQGILDTIHKDGEHLGCADLMDIVDNRVQPHIHAFGHIHGGYGQRQWRETLYINAAICNEAYRPVNAPIVIDL